MDKQPIRPTAEDLRRVLNPPKVEDFGEDCPEYRNAYGRYRYSRGKLKRWQEWFAKSVPPIPLKKRPKMITARQIVQLRDNKLVQAIDQVTAGELFLGSIR